MREDAQETQNLFLSQSSSKAGKSCRCIGHRAGTMNSVIAGSEERRSLSGGKARRLLCARTPLGGLTRLRRRLASSHCCLVCHALLIPEGRNGKINIYYPKNFARLSFPMSIKIMSVAVTQWFEVCRELLLQIGIAPKFDAYCMCCFCQLSCFFVQLFGGRENEWMVQDWLMQVLCTSRSVRSLLV